MAHVSDLTRLITNALENYTDGLKEVISQAQDDLSKESVTRLKASSPKDKGDYASSWKRKKTSAGYVVYNAKHYQLTHLLEHGHVKRGGGRVAARVHIKPVEQHVVEDFERRVERAIESWN